MPGTTPVYGFPYPEPTDLVADYPALGQQLAEDIEDVLPTLGGLSAITPTSIANSGGTATLTDRTVTFTSVNSVSLNGVFSATYRSYVVYVQYTGTNGTTFFYRWRVGGTDNSAANYSYVTYRATGTSMQVSTVTGDTKNNLGYNGAVNQALIIQMFDPFTASGTIYFSHNLADSTLMDGRSGRHTTSTSFDGFTLLPDSGTISGTVTVYGLAK